MDNIKRIRMTYEEVEKLKEQSEDAIHKKLKENGFDVNKRVHVENFITHRVYIFTQHN